MKIAYFHCFSGISGDMTLGALVDLGLDPELLKSELAKLNLEGYELEFEKVVRKGIAGTKAHVKLNHYNSYEHDHNHDHNHEHDHQSDHTHIHGRNLGDIRRLISESKLSDDIKSKAEAIFVRLGEAEAKVHNVSLDEVHFHEVGAVDSIVDIVGSVIGISMLEIKKIYASPLSLGNGFVKSSHGVIPVPAPATLEILNGVSVKQTDIQSELVTPTGAAIISTLADGFGSMPDMTVENIGYGAGTKDLPDQPNLLRIVVGESGCDYENDTVSIVETNIDDMSPQVYDYLIDKLLEIGALDVFLTPIVMKKNRPAVKLTALVDLTHLQEVYSCIISETTTMGVRIYEADRKKLAREIVSVNTQYGKVRVKLGKIGDEVVKVLPEYDDCKRLAEENNISVMKIQQSALSALTKE